MLYHCNEIGLAGFEPTTSYTPSKRASQAALQPVTNNTFLSGSGRSDNRSFGHVRRLCRFDGHESCLALGLLACLVRNGLVLSGKDSFAVNLEFFQRSVPNCVVTNWVPVGPILGV